VKLVASVRTLSSRWLAVCCAAAYVVVSAVLGAALLVRPDVPSVASPASTLPTYVADEGSRDSSTSRPPPQGFQRVTGPAKVQTLIPVGWRIARSGGPGAMRASDPSDAGRFVGYGGAPSATADIAKLHLDVETQFAARATEWEYEHNDGSGTQHVRALYWLVDGVEYFVFASGPQAQWSRMQPVYDAMVANSRP
jgi:hypothetical protein